MADGWNVAPDQVAAVLNAVYRVGQPLVDALATSNGLLERRSDLIAGGRTLIADAWSEFMGDRVLMPGKVIATIASAAQDVAEGAAIIASADLEMAREWRADNSQLFNGLVVGP